MHPNRLKQRLSLMIAVILLILSAAGAVWLLIDLPSFENIYEQLTIPSIRITDRFGRLLYEVIAEEGGRHKVVQLVDIPLSLQQATIATEDSSFYRNPGVDLRGILRAFWINLQGGETLAGGSTITQQVARNLLLETGERYQRSLRRKLRESLLAWQLAHNLSKDEILVLYLNHMYYGNMAYGVEAAAQTYFGKSVTDLDLAECALLAGLPQAPSYYNPLTDPQAAKERQLIVLDLMEKQGVITKEGNALAAQEKLIFTARPYPIEAPHFVLMVREQIWKDLPPDVLYQSGGVTVRTSLDLDWQHHAERIISDQLEALNNPSDTGPGHRARNAALFALDPDTGQILAMVGSPDYFDPAVDGAINMVLAPRQPGSALKPLIYAAAMDPSTDKPWTAGTMILDIHTAFVTHDGQSYVPVNYDLQEHGPVLVRQALGSSLNIPAVRTLGVIGLDSVFDLAAKIGITTFKDPDRYDLSLALGGGEVRLAELAAAYATFANGGYRITPTSILEIRDARDEILYQQSQNERVQVLDPRVAWLITDILSDNEARTLAFGPNSMLRIGRPAAVKTGTTTDFRDNWTIGFTPELVVGVWVGNTDYQSMLGVTGMSGAAPIWHQFIRTVMAGEPVSPFEQPSGLIRVEICALSGLLPTEACPFHRSEWFIVGTEPTQPDTLYQQVVLDTARGCLAEEATPQERQVVRTVLDLPPEAYPWARAHDLVLFEELMCESNIAVKGTEPEGASLQLIAPDPMTIFHISPSLPIDAQQLHLEAVFDDGLREVRIWVDDESVATLLEPPYEAWWTLRLGTHLAWAEGITDTGQRIISEKVEFEVLAPES